MMIQMMGNRKAQTFCENHVYCCTCWTFQADDHVESAGAERWVSLTSFSSVCSDEIDFAGKSKLTFDFPARRLALL